MNDVFFHRCYLPEGQCFSPNDGEPRFDVACSKAVTLDLDSGLASAESEARTATVTLVWDGYLRNYICDHPCMYLYVSTYLYMHLYNIIYIYMYIYIHAYI